MEVLVSPRDRRAAAAGATALAVVAIVYPLIAETSSRPLAVFVLPPLLTAVLGGWRPTVLVGTVGLIIAIVTGLLGPLDKTALAARWTIVVIGTVMGAIGAAVREAQSDRLVALGEAVTLRAAFERALAPAPIPPPGFEAVSRYRPAESRMHLGGDFLEGVALSDGRCAVLIGDVCGHGPREAAFGSALRAGWKAIALGGGDPIDWVASLDEAFFRDGRIDTYATLCTGWIDRQIGLTRLVTLGHPPPIVLGRTPNALSIVAAPPLGLGDHVTLVATEHRWSGAPRCSTPTASSRTLDVASTRTAGAPRGCCPGSPRGQLTATSRRSPMTSSRPRSKTGSGATTSPYYSSPTRRDEPALTPAVLLRTPQLHAIDISSARRARRDASAVR
jgi:hypothetical protein